VWAGVYSAAACSWSPRITSLSSSVDSPAASDASEWPCAVLSVVGLRSLWAPPAVLAATSH